MEGKTVKETSITLAQVMLPPDANISGNVHGGTIMRLIDMAAGVVALRHARGNVVTASVDRINFVTPVRIGDLVMFKASLNMVGKTSMEIGVRVESENARTGEKAHTASAYLTMVALDRDQKPTQVAPLILETEEDFRRNREATARKELRLRERKQQEQA